EIHGILSVRSQVAEERSLPATEGEERHRCRDAEVDAEHAGLNPCSKFSTSRTRLGEQGHGIAIATAVGQPDGLVEVAGTQHADHRTEDLLPPDEHFRHDVVEDGRADETATWPIRNGDTSTIQDELGTFTDTAVDGLQDAATLGQVDHRAQG